MQHATRASRIAQHPTTQQHGSCKRHATHRYLQNVGATQRRETADAMHSAVGGTALRLLAQPQAVAVAG